MKSMKWVGLALVAMLVLGILIPGASGQSWQLQATLDQIQRNIMDLSTKLYKVELVLKMRDVQSDKLYDLDQRIKNLERKTESFDPSIESLRKETLEMRIGTLESRIDDIGNVSAIRSDFDDLKRHIESSIESQEKEIDDLRHGIEVLKARPARR